MSLDVYLTNEHGEELYSGNITHNLGRMAMAAEIYGYLWHPEELGIDKAAPLIAPIKAGLCKLVTEPAKFKQYDSPNGWGLYEHFVPFVINYLQALQEYPDATVRTST